MTSRTAAWYRRVRSGARRALLNSPAGPLVRLRYWVVDQPQPSEPRPVEDFRLLAILGTWMEEDVVEACVANAFAQGCEAVYLIDNGSTDDTVRRAVEAGAVFYGSFTAPIYDEGLRMHHMQSAAEHITSQSDSESVWWLWLDADEFPRGPGSETIHSFLSNLDRRFRVVGARYLDHLPSGPVPERLNDHPLRWIPYCVEHAAGPCFLKHRKHSLVRFERSQPAPRMGNGFHRLEGVTGMLEPSTGIVIHHFPYRNRISSLRRLELLCGAREGMPRIAVHEQLELGRESNSSRRLRELRDVYEQHWNELEIVQRFGLPELHRDMR